MENKIVNVIGAGLAGSEAAWQLASRGIKVRLFDMKPKKMSPAHKYTGFSELVCSNSLRSNQLSNACGLLKEEMRVLNSLIMKAADKFKVPAGSALAVDRYKFSDFISITLKGIDGIEIINEEVTKIPKGPVIIATGPLTSENLLGEIGRIVGEEYCFFFDAAAPIVTAESIDMDKAFFASRYDKGSDYLNCAMDKEAYYSFVDALINAECVELKDFENKNVFEGCMPVEVMAKRGRDTLAFGPLKPVGIKNPRSDFKPYAVVQLRRENEAGTLYNIVGFQTHLKFGEQKRVFSLIPGLENAEFVRYGVMHKNTFINSPKLLGENYRLKSNGNIFFAGQISGVEGYVESASSGLLTGIAAAYDIKGAKMPELTDITAIGALPEYVSNANPDLFQPMNINFGIIKPLEQRIRNKMEKNTIIANRSIEYLKSLHINEHVLEGFYV
ncbi:MAG: methylenetetrahydrofolate--tRNA-(uracil(54)-C(5))-methyltransferase (FADH(2)-oxidizing) TrmFO [Eubacteriales bacterium]